jgi:multiple sugar transport system ATP-binding protein
MLHDNFEKTASMASASTAVRTEPVRRTKPAEIRFESVVKQFPDGTIAVDRLSLSIGAGEFMVVVGPSGSGKSTVLRMLAGLDEPSSGQIEIDGRNVVDVDPKQRDLAMVFQNYALYPHMSVFRNMEFGLKMTGVKKDVRRERVRAAARLLSIEELLGRRPKALSGGQRQRVAMGRAIVREPRAFLMDEPLSNLDAKLRVVMRSEIARLHQRLGTTTLYVTHDQTEAMTLGTRVAVMRDGRLEQVDVPQGLYDSPSNRFVAGFIGSPSMNMVRAELSEHRGRLRVSFGGHALSLPDRWRMSSLESYVGREVVLGIRPEAFEDAALTNSEPDTTLVVDVTLAEPVGDEVIVHFPVASGAAGAGDLLALEYGLQDSGLSHGLTEFVARLDPKTSARTGNRINVSCDVERAYFFDPETDRAIR